MLSKDKVRVQVSIHKDMYDKLDKCAKQFGLTKSQYVSMVVSQRLAKDCMKIESESK